MGKIKVIGVTGGCGTGKSTVASFLKEKGGFVIDADAVTKELQQPGGSAYEEILAWLGEDYLCPDGQLNRKKIADLVFEDRKALSWLNRIVHTRVAEEIKIRIARIQREKPDTAFIVLDVPIPIEHGFLDTCDVIWAVVANDDLRVERLMNRMGISEEEAEARLKNQWSNREYEAIADVVIENEKDPDDLKKQIDRALDQSLTV